MSVLAVLSFLFWQVNLFERNDELMAVIRQTRSTTLFRCLVVPAMLLCGIFRKPVLQWIALGTVLIWLVAELSLAIGRSSRNRKQHQLLRRLAEPTETPALTQVSKEPESQELFLIRQINYRVTEQLKSSYPMVSWVWQTQPEVGELCQGGTWRICLSNTEPFNFGEVQITKQGKLEITLLQIVALGTSTSAVRVEPEDLTDAELLERVDVKAWYQEQGEQVLSQIIDNLNTQGHRQILIKEDGAVCITTSSAEELVVDSVLNFPPRKTWTEFCQLLSEDEITASVKPEGLLMAWN